VIVVMGDGPSKASLQQLIAQEGVGDRIKLLPLVPYAELLSWTASADIGLNVLPPDYSPSIYYCLPNKLFEYLMAGLPVLTSRLPAVVEVLRQYDVGQVVDSLDPVTVAEAINALLADTEARTRMRTNALAAARDSLNWEIESQRLVQLYARLGAVGRTPENVAR
jgi:glycosyltransferase involved in cell wall biosynthesis